MCPEIPLRTNIQYPVHSYRWLLLYCYPTALLYCNGKAAGASGLHNPFPHPFPLPRVYCWSLQHPGLQRTTEVSTRECEKSRW